MRRLFELSLIFVLFSCAGESQQENHNTLSNQTILRFAYWGSPEIKQTYERIVSLYEERNPTIKIQQELTNQGFVEKLLTQSAAGSSPDLFAVECSFFHQFASKNVLLPLSNFIRREEAFNINDFQPQILNAFSSNKQLFAIPMDMGVEVLYYNKKCFREASLAYPPNTWENDWWTWDTFLDYAKRLTRDHNNDGRIDQYGVVVERNIWNAEPWIYQSGGELLDSEMTTCLMDSPQTIVGMKFFADLFLLHRVAPTPSMVTDMGSESSQLFSIGRAAMYPSGFWRIREFNEVKDLEWDVAPCPMAATRATTWHGSAIGIGAKTLHPRQCWDFVNFLVSPEVQKIWAQTGVLIPSRRSILNSTEFLQMEGMPESLSVFIEGFDWAMRTPQIYEDPEMEFIINQKLDLAWEGIKPVPEVCRIIAKTINQRLAAKQSGKR